MQTEILIRERAYAIWQQEGCPQGREWDHWVRAAGEVIGGEERLTFDPIEIAAPVKSAKAKGRSKARKS